MSVLDQHVRFLVVSNHVLQPGALLRVLSVTSKACTGEVVQPLPRDEPDYGALLGLAGQGDVREEGWP